MNPISVFVDSDVIISSLLSNKGAAYHLCTTPGSYMLSISDISVIELQNVAKRLDIEEEALAERLTVFEKVPITPLLSQATAKMNDYTLDRHDMHIVLGAQAAKATFLLTYNLKHYHTDKIRKDFHIVTLTPARFLQYLRSKPKQT